MSRLRPSLLFSLLVSGCTCCSGPGPTAGGPTPYVRCAMVEPPAIEASVGALHLTTHERVLTIEGATAPLHVAAFRGAALADEPLEPALDAIESGAPALQIVLGSLGDDASRVEALLRALAELPSPSIVVMGGRDHPADLAAALAALPAEARAKIIDASGLRSIRVAGVDLVPVAGAPDGRYARDDEACGIGASDAETIASEVGSDATPRFLVGYAAPSPLPGIDGAEAGSALVADLATRVGARSGLFAWPDARSVPSAHIVPPLAGPPALLADGARLGPGVLFADIGPEGITEAAAPGVP